MSLFTARRFGVATAIVVTLTVCTDAADSRGTTAPVARASQNLFPEVPDDGAESRLPGERFDFLRGDSVGGVVEGAPSPQVSEYHGSRAVDLINRRRNWIYSTQSPSSFELSAERALGVRSTEPAASSGDAGWLSDFFYDREKTPTRQFADALSQSMQVPGLNSSSLGAAPGLGSAHQLDPLMTFQNAGTVGTSPSSARSGLVGGMGQSGLSGVPVTVRELLSSPGSVNPLAAGFDPINLRVDSTRQELNPTLPDPLADLNQTPRTVDALLGQPTRSVSEGRPSTLDNFNARMLGNSSLAPAVAPMSESRPVARPLGSGQYPIRKF